MTHLSNAPTEEDNSPRLEGTDFYKNAKKAEEFNQSKKISDKWFRPERTMLTHEQFHPQTRNEGAYEREAKRLAAIFANHVKEGAEHFQENAPMKIGDVDGIPFMGHEGNGLRMMEASLFRQTLSKELNEQFGALIPWNIDVWVGSEEEGRTPGNSRFEIFARRKSGNSVAYKEIGTVRKLINGVLGK